MNVKKNLIEIGSYFKQKLIEGDYQFIKSDQYTAFIVMDGEFKFQIWINNTNETPDNFQVYTNNETESYSNQYFRFTEEEVEDQVKAWELMAPKIKEYKTETLITQKTQELEDLKNSL